jgi:hypothetical protein
VEPDRPDRDDTEERWRSIVDNYGARAELDDPFVGDPDLAPELEAWPDPTPDPVLEPMAEPMPAPVPEPADEEERYEPPAPPPLPRVAPDRLVAWTGVFGSPVVLLAALIVGISLPSWLGYLLVASFVGGFGYLVYKMPRGPRDPWDDGAQV